MLTLFYSVIKVYTSHFVLWYWNNFVVEGETASHMQINILVLVMVTQPTEQFCRPGLLNGKISKSRVSRFTTKGNW